MTLLITNQSLYLDYFRDLAPKNVNERTNKPGKTADHNRFDNGLVWYHVELMTSSYLINSAVHLALAVHCHPKRGRFGQVRMQPQIKHTVASLQLMTLPESNWTPLAGGWSKDMPSSFFMAWMLLWPTKPDGKAGLLQGPSRSWPRIFQA